MRKYEGMFLLDSNRLKNDVQKGVEHVTDVLRKVGAAPSRVDRWDERKLAYEIRGQKRGLYVLACFEADGRAVTELNRECNLSEVVLRMLCLEREAFAPFQTAAELEAQWLKRDGHGADDWDTGGDRRGRPPRSRSYGGGGPRGGEAVGAPDAIDAP